MNSYIIASNPRSGSHLLRGILSQNKCGNPTEALIEFIFFEKSNEEPKTIEAFRRPATKGDFCGMTIQVRHLKEVYRIVEKLTGRVPENILQGLNIFCPNPKFIYLHRIDKVRQAISHVKAKRTSNYSHFPFDKKKEVDYGEYNNIEITEYMKRSCVWDSFWLDFFDRNAIEPLTISYEELVKNKVLTAVKIFEFLGHTPDMIQMNPDLLPIRQYDEVSQDWYDKYHADE